MVRTATGSSDSRVEKIEFAISRSIRGDVSADPLLYILVCSVSMLIRRKGNVSRAIKSTSITHRVNHHRNCVGRLNAAGVGSLVVPM